MGHILFFCQMAGKNTHNVLIQVVHFFVEPGGIFLSDSIIQR